MREGGEQMVGIGELAVSTAPDHVLLALGLGSCIGLVVVDSTRPYAGLAHIMLPDSQGATTAPAAKFADRAVPALIEAMTAAGALRSRMQAVLVGGAQMFRFGAGVLDVGRRNEEATRRALAKAGLDVVAAATGGTTGRTVRVHAAGGTVVVKEAGGAEVELLSASSSLLWVAS